MENGVMSFNKSSHTNGFYNQSEANDGKVDNIFDATHLKCDSLYGSAKMYKTNLVSTA